LGKDESAHSVAQTKLSWISRNAQNATGPSHPYGMPFLLARPDFQAHPQRSH
jgi:hypothetical protein